MADLNTEQVKSFIEALNAMNAIHPAIGIVVAILGVITGILTLINNFRTKKNTQANTQTVETLTQFKNDMDKLKSEATKEVRESVDEFKTALNHTAHGITESLSGEVRKVKIVVAKVHELSEQKLSMIPKLQDRVELIEKKNTEILDILTKGKRGTKNGL